jgi:hypothetical protein
VTVVNNEITSTALCDEAGTRKFVCASCPAFPSALLASLEHITALDLSHCTGLHTLQTLQTLQLFPTMKSLSLAATEMEAFEAVHVANYLQENKTLTEIDISENCIADDGWDAYGTDALGAVLKTNSTLRSLNIANNGILCSALAGFVRDIADARALSTLIFSGGRRVSKPVVLDMAATEADLSSSYLEASGGLVLSKFLPRCTSLTKLNLANNGRTPRYLHGTYTPGYCLGSIVLSDSSKQGAD